MMRALFHVPLFSYDVKEWDRKKKALLSRINRCEFEYRGLNDFKTDRHSKRHNYAIDFENIFSDELNEFKREADLQYLSVMDVWTIKYTQKSENHCPHNHRSSGYTGLLYLEYDEKVHEPTKFIGPWNDPVKDTTQLSQIHDAKTGVMYIWPSSLVHYVDGMRTNKLRMITSWDMEVK